MDFYEFLNKINEGLIKTVNIEKTKDLMFRYLSNSNKGFDFDIKIKDKDNNSLSIFLNFTYKEINESIINLMNNMGWFPSYITIYKDNLKRGFKYDEKLLNNSNIKIIFESKFDEKVEDKYDKLYHVTVSNKVNKIKKVGLSPKSNHRLSNHPDRVYLTVDPNKILISFLNLDKLYGKNVEYEILEIDNSGSDNIELYYDPNFDDGFYTYDNIHPDKISVK